MSQHVLPSDAWHRSGAGRVGDVSAMLRLMEPLKTGGADEKTNRRRLLADLCRLVGAQVGAMSSRPTALDPSPPASAKPAAMTHAAASPSVGGPTLTPRQEQTLRLLLTGHSEKQVAQQLCLSPHTVHVYVKKLYRRFGVSTRAELLAHHLGPTAAAPDGSPVQGT